MEELCVDDLPGETFGTSADLDDLTDVGLSKEKKRMSEG